MRPSAGIQICLLRIGWTRSWIAYKSKVKDDVLRSLIVFTAFMVIDFLTCVVAFALEKKEDWKLLAPLLPQRFVYRQIMYWVLLCAVMRKAQ